MRTKSAGILLPLLLSVPLLLGLPLVGVVLQGEPLTQYMQFPPRTERVEHAPFSWPVFIGLAAGIVLVIAPFVRKVLSARTEAARAARRHPFPAWGWAGVVWTLLAWTASWARFPWLAPLRLYIFPCIWLGYIVTVNALTVRRSGRCMLTGRPAYVLLLFPFSATFWWFFEYLNRFTRNWYYVGAGDASGLEYFTRATLAFATVLPAVMGTCELLRTFPRLTAGLSAFRPVRLPRPRAWAAATLPIGGAGLAGLGVWPDLLFPLLWLAPLFLIVSIQVLLGRTTVLHGVTTGDWRRICLLALAALVCGFFWEMWNIRSLPKWVYAVPFVDRFHLFEMPILGYAGYLPFGLECAVLADILQKSLTPARKHLTVPAP